MAGLAQLVQKVQDRSGRKLLTGLRQKRKHARTPENPAHPFPQRLKNNLLGGVPKGIRKYELGQVPFPLQLLHQREEACHLCSYLVQVELPSGKAIPQKALQRTLELLIGAKGVCQRGGLPPGQVFPCRRRRVPWRHAVFRSLFPPKSYSNPHNTG